MSEIVVSKFHLEAVESHCNQLLVFNERTDIPPDVRAVLYRFAVDELERIDSARQVEQ